MNFEDFKRKLADSIFSSTSTEELSVERIYEVVDDIADNVIKIAKEYIKNKR